MSFDAFPGQCAACHGPEPEYPVMGVRMSYNQSGHNKFGNSWYANGNGCQACHTHEGFLEYLETGAVEGHVAYPSQPNCFTCHDAHTTGDFSVRIADPVRLENGEIFDMGDGNLCANCHKARRDAADYVQPTAANRVSAHFGPHHGPQADMLLGANAYEFPGKRYAPSAHTAVLRNGCTECHMAVPEGRYSLSPEVGGHSFNILGEVHEDELANVAGCVNCHEGIQQVRGEEIFDIAAKADYDNDGEIEPVQAEVQGLLEYFVNDRGTGVLQTMDDPFYGPDGTALSSSSTAMRSVEEMAALYNYKFVAIEDRSLGIHNTRYTIQILYDSLEALNPSLDTRSRRP
jgi:hypothetical protein